MSNKKKSLIAILIAIFIISSGITIVYKLGGGNNSSNESNQIKNNDNISEVLIDDIEKKSNDDKLEDTVKEETANKVSEAKEEQKVSELTKEKEQVKEKQIIKNTVNKNEAKPVVTNTTVVPEKKVNVFTNEPIKNINNLGKEKIEVVKVEAKASSENNELEPKANPNKNEGTTPINNDAGANPPSETNPPKVENEKIFEVNKTMNDAIGSKSQLMVINIEGNGNPIEEAKAIAYKEFPEAVRKDLYFGNIVSSQKYISVLNVGEKIQNIKTPNDGQIAEVKFIEGLFISNENNELVLKETHTDVQRKSGEEIKQTPRIHLISGNVSNDEKLFAGEFVLGLEGNTYNGGIQLTSEAKNISGINFKVEKTPAQVLNYSAVITSFKDKYSDLTIENNTFNFGENSEYARSGISIGSPVSGYLKIHNNKFGGSNTGNKIPTGGSESGMIRIIDLMKTGDSIEISENIIENSNFHGMALMVGEAGKIDIVNNKISNVGQNGIILSIFDNPKNILIENNTINNYGTREIIVKENKYIPDSPTKEINTFEQGLLFEYIYQVYGVKVNNKWFNDKDKLKEMLLMKNTISSAEENNKLAGVLDSTACEVGRESTFHDPKVAINNKTNYKKYNKDDFVIIKDDDDDVVWGVNNQVKNNPKIEVKSLTIIGDGQGKIELPSTLTVLGDLIIDAPQATLKNNAIVKGNIIIKNIKDNDNSGAKFELISGAEFIKGSSEESGLIIKVSELKDNSGNIITTETANLDKTNFEVYVGEEQLEAADYDVNSTNCELIIKKEYLDKLLKSTTLKLTLKNVTANMTAIKSLEFNIIINDFSNATISPDNATFTFKEAPEAGITFKITNLSNKAGKVLKANETVLKDSVSLSRYNYIANQEDIIINDETDEITLTKKLLDNLKATHFADHKVLSFDFTGKYTLTIENEENGIGLIEKEIVFRIENKSSADINLISVNTFTTGKAPEEGISFAVTNIIDYKGKPVSAKDSVLKNNIKIESFPVDWGLDYIGNGSDIKFDPNHYEIDDVKDIITLKKAYLDKIDANRSQDTEGGLKIFTFTYSDSKNHVEARSEKNPIHIKLIEKARSENVEIDFNEEAFKFNDPATAIEAGKVELKEGMLVSEVLQHIKKGNPRQQLKVYPKEAISDNKITEVTKWKKGYQSIESGDVLLVVAENGINQKTYKLELGGAINSPVNEWIDTFNKENIIKIDRNYIRIKSESTVSSILNEMQLKEGVEKRIIEKSTSKIVSDTEIITEDMILVLTKGDAEHSFAFRISTAKPVYKALLVGNYDYFGTKQDLVGPQNDLPLLGKVFKNSVIDGNTFTNVDKVTNVKKAELLAAITETFANSKDEDVSYFYYSGHGFNIDGISYLCTIEDSAEASDNPNNWVSVDELHEALSKVRGTKIVILDCCNAGGFIGKEFIDVLAGASVKGKIDENNKEADVFQKTFTENAVKVFKAEENAKANYLTGNDFKVLTASSANEFSFEDKKEQIGKFTKQLAIAVSKSGMAKADKNEDNKLSLTEAYDYLHDNIASISHIQVFPYGDTFTLFEGIASDIGIEDNDVEVTDKDASVLIESKKINDKEAYNIIYNPIEGAPAQAMISSKEIKIEVGMTVEDFLNNIEKTHPNQVLAVYPKYVNLEVKNAKNASDKIAKLDRLVVTSESGIQQPYLISSVEASAEQNATAKIESVLINGKNAYEITYKTNKKGVVLGYIKAGEVEINSKMTVEEFLSHIKKLDPTQSLSVYSHMGGYTEENVKALSANMARGDKLGVKAEGVTRIIHSISVKEIEDGIIDEPTVEVQVPEVPKVNFGRDFKLKTRPIEVLSSNDTELSNQLTVEQFLSKLKNRQDYEFVGVYDSEVYIKEDGAKLETENLKKGDKLVCWVKGNDVPKEIRLDIKEKANKKTEKDIVPDFGAAFTVEKFGKKNFQISSGNDELVTSLTVGEFLGEMTNKDEFEFVGVFTSEAKPEKTNAKKSDEKLAKGDMVLCWKKDGSMPIMIFLEFKN